ncbi:MAG: hypothetical protein J5966_01670 [Lachnospiraceae bacterium]|nr:hypothetical protein [Lachnospiraceae bacterium]
MGDNTPRTIGLPMLIVVFVSICLFSFSGIAYSTAKNSLEQSEGIIERAQNYHGACNEAERVLASLESIPRTMTTYSFPFGTAMEELQVTIVPNENGDDYDIVSWIVSDTASWEAPTDTGNTSGPQGPQGPVGPQ